MPTNSLTGRKRKETYTWLMQMQGDGSTLHPITPVTLCFGDGTATPVSMTTTGLFVGGLAVATYASGGRLTTADSFLITGGDSVLSVGKAMQSNATPALTIPNLGSGGAQEMAFRSDINATNIAALIAGSTSKASPADTDKLGYVTAAGAMVYALWSEIKTWLGTWIDALATIAGAKSATGQWVFTLRPTCTVATVPTADDLLNAPAAIFDRLLAIARFQLMTAPSASSSTGTYSNTISNGAVVNGYSFTVASAGGCRLIDAPYAYAFSKPIRAALFGRLMPSATTSNCVARIFIGAPATPALAGATDVVATAGFGAEIYASGGGYRARLFWCSANGAAVTYSGTGTGAGTVAIPDPSGSPAFGYMLENDGAGNISLRVTGQSNTATNVRVGDVVLTWAGITNTALTYTPSLFIFGATPSASISGGAITICQTALLSF